MPEIMFEAPLDNDELDWFRFRLTTVGGQVRTFVVQYETMLNGRRVAVTRYDNAHGFCHRDVLDQGGNVIDKQPIPGSPAEVVNLGEQDIRSNWRRYRRQFHGDD